MAEKVTSLAVENVIEQLEQVPAIVKETQKLKSLRRVKTRFSTISTLLEEFDGQEYEPGVAAWLKKVRDVVYKTQEVISSIVVETNNQNQKSKLGRLYSREKVNKHHAEAIENIEEQINSIYSFKDVAGSNEESHHIHRSICFKNDEVVGFRDAQDTLVRTLIGDTETQPLEVLLIHGKAGSGKTTLAKMICNDGRIKKHFGEPEWMSFPQELPLVEKLVRTLKFTSSTSNQIDCLSKDELKTGFWERLKGKRYLVVIDRVYNNDELDGLMSLFPNESHGSRILLTSRVPRAKLHVQQKISFSYEVKPLDANQSWQLLSRKLLEWETHSELENLGKRLAETCKGSPRAIMAMAAILNSAEKTVQMWSKILEGYADLSSYYDLHKDVKFCFLYFGLFPEDVSISAKQMIQMWMAEGLLKKKGGKEAEEIGEEYLKKLIDQSLIQIGTRRADKSVKTCRASSHISRFLITEGAAAKFFEVHMNNNLKPNTDIKMKAIHSESVTEVLKIFENCSAQSLHCFAKNTHPTPIRLEGFWETLLNGFPQLKVLNLGFLELDKVPKELGKLNHLRYLRLRVPNAKHLPSFIVNLQQLETLDMRESCCPINLPQGIWKMQFLRHLYLGAFTYLPKTRGSALSNLQTISGVYSDKNLKWLMVRAKFPNVRKLRIRSFDSYITCNFLNSLDHLYHLQSLRVEKSTKLPSDLNAFPLSLTKLTLLKTKLQPKCFKTLEKLPNLRILKLLKKAISGEEIACSDGGFLQLEVLYVENLIVKNWRMGEGAMECLKRFFINGCNADILETAPEKLREAKENGTKWQEFTEAATILREG